MENWKQIVFKEFHNVSTVISAFIPQMVKILPQTLSKLRKYIEIIEDYQSYYTPRYS